MDQRQRPPFDLLPPPAASDAVAAPWPPGAPRLSGRDAHLIKCLAKGRDAADLVNAWPAQLIAMVEIAEAAIRTCLEITHPPRPPSPAVGRGSKDPASLPGLCALDPQTLARCIVAAQASAIGGGRIHFPTAERVERLLRDAKIWREFDGRNVKSLAAKYRLDEYTVYRILKRQRDLRRKVRGLRGVRP